MFNRAATRSFSSSRAQQLKLVARDAPDSLLSSVTLKIAQAGSSNGKSGVAHLLAKYSFLNNEAKLALRFTREAELLGGVWLLKVTRDLLVLNAQFLKQDLPFFVEALANSVAKPSFRPHEFVETVKPAALAESKEAKTSPAFVASEELHAISFKRSYGQPLYYDGSSSVTLDDVTEFAAGAFTSSNVSLYASGVVEADLASFVAELSLSGLSAGLSSSAASTPVSFTGKEARIRSTGENVALIGVPVAPEDFASYELLSAALGSAFVPSLASPLAALQGSVSSQLYKYNGAGLFVISASDASAEVVAASIKAAKKLLDASVKDVATAQKDAQLAVAIQSSFESPVDVAVSGSTKAPKVSGFNYVAVGDVDVLPYPDEL